MKLSLVLGISLSFLSGQVFAQKYQAAAAGVRALNTANKGSFKTQNTSSCQVLNLELERSNFCLMSSKKVGENEYALQNAESESLELAQQEKQINANTVEKRFVVANKGAAGPRKQIQPGLDANKINALYMLRVDPNVTTQLKLKMGVGSARLNFADVKLENVDITGGFSDIWIDFEKLNGKRMPQFNLHNAAGNITVRYPENANAEVLHIQNDMSSIKLVVGKNTMSSNNCILKTVRGPIWITIDKSQPIKLIVKKGMMASFTPPKGFTKKSEDVYVNNAYLKTGGTKFLTITCATDLGSIEVVEE
ncbi:MAG: hypothetical protein ACKVTZ_23630 [Bacteroidia bacterium]